jgi:cell division protein FtsA
VLFRSVLTEIKRSGYDGLLPAGVVLCGGTSQLAGLKPLAREVLKLPVRIGEAVDVEGLTDRISSPSFAASVGVVRWGLRRNEEQAASIARVATRGNGRPRVNLISPLVGVGGWLKRALLPEKGE